MDCPTTDIRVGIILTKTPNTINNGPNKSASIDTIQAVAVLPILVPRRINKLSLKVTTPLLTSDTVKDDINVLDWTIDVAIPPKAKPPNGITVTLPIHLESLSRPKLSISLLKLCSP